MNTSYVFLAPLRFAVRRILRRVLKMSPDRLKLLATRIPFSRYSWMLPRMFWGHEQIRWRGVDIIVNPGEVHGFYPYFLGDYSGDEIDILIELCTSAQCLADVGANIGLVSLALAHACPNLHVYAFEPDPIIASRFKSNLVLNPNLIPRVKLIEKAVADHVGTARFQSAASGYNIEVGHLADEALGSITVEMVRLDTFFALLDDYPDIVKIDIEGAELRALDGMKGLFETQTPEILIVEVHAFSVPEADRPRFNQCVENLLVEAGYALSQLNGKSLLPSAEWPSRIHLKAAQRRST